MVDRMGLTLRQALVFVQRGSGMFRKSIRGLVASLGLLIVGLLLLAINGNFNGDNVGLAFGISFALGFSGVFHS